MPPRLRTCGFRLAMCVAVLACGAARLRAGEDEPKRRLKSDPTQEYYVYLPGNFDAAKRYWLFVAVHGLGGKGEGALGWAEFADEGQCIVVGPTFSGQYQMPTAKNEYGQKMIAIHKELSRQYKLQRKFFITGFSAGAQFAHRFTLECPQHVVGCAAHSAGSWSGPNARAKYVPFVVTCGEDDRQRIHMARNFADDLERKGYKVTTGWFKGVDHSMCEEARKLTKDLYWAATTGMTVEERGKAAKALEEGERLFKDGKFAEAYQVLAKLARGKRKSEFAERAASTLRQIAKLGGEKLAEIEEQSKTDVAAAIKALEKLQDDFKGFRVAKAAAQMLHKLKGGQGAETAPEPAAPDEPAETKPMPKPRPKPTTATTGTKSGQTAARWLSLARNFIANNKKDMARGYLKRIITRFPESDEAAEAKTLLMELEGT